MSKNILPIRFRVIYVLRENKILYVPFRVKKIISDNKDLAAIPARTKFFPVPVFI
jgi:hypothetical protein